MVVGLLASLIGLFLFSGSKTGVVEPKTLQDDLERLATNRFISAKALRNLQHRRNAPKAMIQTGSVFSENEEEGRPNRSQKESVTQRRDELRSACIALLDAQAFEHPSGHTKQAARYVLRSEKGERIELLFEKNLKGRLKLWVASEFAHELTNIGIEWHAHLATEIYQANEFEGPPKYGRHSALKLMRALANVDLVSFTIDRPEDLHLLLTKLSTVG